MEEIEKILKEFGYTQEWLDAGIIDEEFLRKDYAEYLSSDDKNQEHYRTGGFWHYLKSKDSLTDEEIETILTLRDDGPDGCDLSWARIDSLVHYSIVTDEQEDRLSQYLISIHPGYEENYKLRLLGRRIRDEGLPENVVEIIKQSGKSFLHNTLLEHEEVTRDHLIWLEQHGGNKAIRNRARQMLTSRKFRKQRSEDDRL